MAEFDWNDNLPQGWEEQVAAWPWQWWGKGEAQFGWVKDGACPRCGHTIAIYQRLGFLPLTGDVPAACNCGKSHPGRPDDDEYSGCGPYTKVKGHS